MTTSTRHERTGRREPNPELKLTLAMGFAGLAVALIAAASTPAQGYELSIYQATPTLFWVGVAIALVTSLLVSFTSDVPRSLYNGALVLAGSSIWSILAIPLIRGYYYYGAGDALSHVGFARLFADGSLSPLNLIYPAVHVITLAVSWTTGLAAERSMVLTVLIFFGIYLVFVPLCVRELTDDDRATAVGLFSAILLLPINNVAVHVITHPSSQAILFAPFVLFLLFLYLSRSEGKRSLFPTAAGVLLAVGSSAIVFVHPEQALNVIVIFGTILLLGFVYRRVDPDHPIGRHSPLYVQTAFVVAVFLLWAPRSSRTQSRLDTLMASIAGTGSPAGGEVAQRAGSLAAVGGSLEELFVKLFFVSLVFSALAGVVMIAAATGRLDDVFPRRNAYGKHLTAAFVPLLGGTGVIFYAGFGDHYFRYIGFLMMLATILGAAGLVKAIPVLLSRVSGPTLRKATIVLFVVLLPIAVLSVHPSPWIYQSSEQVTEARMGGYQTAFEHRDPEVSYAGIRGGPRRYVDATYGTGSTTAEEFPGTRAAVPPGTLAANLTSNYEDPRYVPVSDGDIWREVVIYREFRYDWAGFRSLETTPGVNRVQSNEDLQVYFVSDGQR